MEDLEYITSGALVKCDQGAAPDFFKPTFNQKVKIHGCLVATKADNVSLRNIPSFKVCMLTQKPCIPIITLWENTWQVKINGQNALIGRSTCKCTVGGTIEFLTSGQIPLPDDAQEEVKELQEKAQKVLDDSGNGDSVGEAGFLEGMIPVWGSGRDMINAIQTGDGLGATLNAGFLIWDCASIVAGVFSLGTGTVAMQGAKATAKASMKTAAKKIGQKVVKGLGRVGFNKLGKEALELGLKKMAQIRKIFCVTACFPAGTPIHTENGLVNIEDIKIGYKVYSYDTERGELTLRNVVSLFENTVDEIFEITTIKGVIRTTRNHPFFVNGEFKDAEQLAIGDYLLNHREELHEIISINYSSEKAKVYSFEVDTDHCYFVGVDGVLVLNACKASYRTSYLDAYRKAKKMAAKLKMEIHHRIPQEWFSKGIFKGSPHSLSNLVDLEKKFHKSITKEWKEFRKHYKNVEKRLPTQAEIYKKAKELDIEIDIHLRKRGF